MAGFLSESYPKSVCHTLDLVKVQVANDHDLIIKIAMNVKIILPSPVLARNRETPLVRASGELSLFV